MIPAQQSALEALAGRTLNADEVAQIDALLPDRNDVAIAAVLSIGRTSLQSRTIDERGVRAQLPVVQADALLSLLSNVAFATSIPEWLSNMLTAMSIPDAEQPAYFRTFACAHPWLQQEAGIDLGVQTTRSMLDMIAAADPATYGASVAVLKALGQRDDPIHYNEVSAALNGAAV